VLMAIGIPCAEVALIHDPFRLRLCTASYVVRTAAID
jgi:hypothetical protein